MAIADDSDYLFGLLHSRVHHLWARAQGTQLREADSGSRYTPTTTFETFPFPEASPRDIAEISAAAKVLNDHREDYLNPPPDSISPSQLKKRTLTSLYNEPPTWLTLAHHHLDEAVLRAYCWETTLSDNEILARLLALNLSREPA